MQIPSCTFDAPMQELSFAVLQRIHQPCFDIYMQATSVHDNTSLEKYRTVTRLAKTPVEKCTSFFHPKNFSSRSHHSMKHSPRSWTSRGLGDEGSGKKVGPPFLYHFSLHLGHAKYPNRNWRHIPSSTLVCSPAIMVSKCLACNARYDGKGMQACKPSSCHLLQHVEFCIVHSAMCLRQSLVWCLFIPSETGLRNTEALF